MQSTASTVDEYIQTVPPERLQAITRLRQLCCSILIGYNEGMEYGMPYYSKDNVPAIAFNSQKNYISLYGIRRSVRDKYQAQLKNTGEGCIRFRRPDQIDFALVEKLLEETASSPA